MTPPIPYAGRKRIIRIPVAAGQSLAMRRARLASPSPLRLQMSSPSRWRGVDTICMRRGQASWAIILLVRSEQSVCFCIHLPRMGGKVKAEATVMMSLRKKRKSERTGKCEAAAAPKCCAQALSLAMPQMVLATKVASRFCMGMGRSGMQLAWSVRLLTQQVMAQTKYIQRNLQEVKNSTGWVNNRRNPFLTPSLTVALPLANSMTERSRMALVGETKKDATRPDRISLGQVEDLRSIDWVGLFNQLGLEIYDYLQPVLLTIGQTNTTTTPRMGSTPNSLIFNGQLKEQSDQIK